MIKLNKLFLLLMMIIVGNSSAWGAEEKITFSSMGYDNGDAVETIEGTDFTIYFNKGDNNNAPRYYDSGDAIRAYGGNYFEVTSPYTITKIVVGFGSDDGTNTISTNVGTYSNGTWTGDAQSVIFTIGGTKGNRRLASIAVTYTKSEIATPTFDPVAGELEKGTVVTFSCNTEGVTLYYTDDNSNPTTNSTLGNTYTVNNNVTLKVIAAKDGKTSDVATASYTVKKNNPNLAFSTSTVTANIGEAFTPPTLTYDDRYDGIITFSSSNSTITVNPTTGEVTFGASAVDETTTITATASETNNFTSATANYVLTVRDPNAIKGNLNNATFGTSYSGSVSAGFDSVTGKIGDVEVTYSRGNSSNAYISNSEIRLYNGNSLTFTAPDGFYIQSLVFDNELTNLLSDEGIISGKQWVANSSEVSTVRIYKNTNTGVPLKTVTISLTSASNIARPTISPASGTYTEAQTVVITNNAEGATVYYTSDGTTPTVSSTPYTAPFALTKNGTYIIKAIAISDEGKSAVTTNTITINHHVDAPVFAEANGTSFTDPYSIHLTAEEGCTIYYSLSGSPVNENFELTGAAIAYNSNTGIANLTKAVSITAVAVDEGGNVSETSMASYKYTGIVSAPYYENFDEGLGNFTTESTGTNPPEWIFRTNSSEADIEKYGEVRKYAFVTGNNSKQGTARLISPIIDLTDKTITTASLNFIHAGRYFDGYNKDNQTEAQTATGEAPSHAQLFIREDGGTWGQVTIPNWFTQNSNYTRRNSGEISLKDYVGKKIQVSFLYTADNESTGTWNVLKFAVTTTNAEAEDSYETVSMKTDGYVTYVVQNDIDWVKTLAKNTTEDGNNINIHGYKVVEFTDKTAVFVEFGVENPSSTKDKWYSEPMIPAEAPIILKGTAGDNLLTIAKSNDVIAKPIGNLLKPSYGDVIAAAGQKLLVFQKEPDWTDTDPYKNYAFYLLTTGRQIPNRKAYLNANDISEELSINVSNPANGIYLLQDLGNEETLGQTEIGELRHTFDLNAPVYDLSGRRVGNGIGGLKAGLYIMNGRKIIIK